MFQRDETFQKDKKNASDKQSTSRDPPSSESSLRDTVDGGQPNKDATPRPSGPSTPTDRTTPSTTGQTSPTRSATSTSQQTPAGRQTPASHTSPAGHLTSNVPAHTSAGHLTPTAPPGHSPRIQSSPSSSTSHFSIATGISMVSGPSIFTGVPMESGPPAGQSNPSQISRNMASSAQAGYSSDTNAFTLRHTPTTSRQGQANPNTSVTTNSSVNSAGLYNSSMNRNSSDTTTLRMFESSRRRSPTPSIYTLEREVKNYMRKKESTAYQLYPGTESSVYEFIEERTDMYTTNLVESTAYLIKGSLGAGVLSMHEAYMYGGLWTSLATTILMGILIAYAMMMLIKSAQTMYGRLRINKLSYPDLAEAAAATSPWIYVRKCSKVFRYTIDSCLFLEMCGTCCIYQIMIAYTLKQVLEGIFSNISEWIMDIRLYILMSTPGLLLLCLIRSLKFLAPFAMLADIFVGMCVMTTLYYSLRTVEVNITERPIWKSPHGFVRFLGICMYCTSGVSIALPVENNMRRPRAFRTAIRYAMTIVVVMISMTGFFGYWGWGEECKSPITIHMPLNTFTTILQFLLVMMLSTTFAVQFWVPFRIVWHYILRKSKRRPATCERLYRFGMAILVTAMSMLFPNLIPVMIFLGQFFLGFITIVFPAFIEFLIYWEGDRGRKACWRCFKNSMLILFGLFLSGSAFYSIRN